MVNNMTLKKIKIINVIFLFLLSFLWHFIYDWFPNSLTAIFFPVNESIWEHMKIIYYVIIIGSILEMLLCKKFDIKINNKYIEMATKAIGGIVFYLLIFVPVYLVIGENMFFALTLLLVTYIFVEWLGYKILLSNELNINIMPIILLILGSILLGILTFYPVHNFLFFDTIKLGYGILK